MGSCTTPGCTCTGSPATDPSVCPTCLHVHSIIGAWKHDSQGKAVLVGKTANFGAIYGKGKKKQTGKSLLIDSMSPQTVLATNIDWAAPGEASGSYITDGFGNVSKVPAEPENEGDNGWVDIENEMKQEEARYRDPTFCVATLRKLISERNKGCTPGDALTPLPVEIEQVFFVNVWNADRSILVRAVREDGGSDTLFFEERHHAGTYMDPPEYEDELWWLSDLTGASRDAALQTIQDGLDDKDDIGLALKPRGESCA